MKTYEMIREQQYDKNKTKKSSRAFCCHVVLLLFAPFRIIAEDFISFRALATLFYLIIHTMCECRIAAIILYLRQESVMLIFSLLAEMGIAKIYYFSSNHWSVVFFSHGFTNSRSAKTFMCAVYRVSALPMYSTNSYSLQVEDIKNLLCRSGSELKR